MQIGLHQSRVIALQKELALVHSNNLSLQYTRPQDIYYFTEIKK